MRVNGFDPYDKPVHAQLEIAQAGLKSSFIWRGVALIHFRILAFFYLPCSILNLFHGRFEAACFHAMQSISLLPSSSRRLWTQAGAKHSLVKMN
jgi:hypothetical protein